MKVDYHVIDRCNLNCIACGHFSPLVPESNKGVSLYDAKRSLALLWNATDKGSQLEELCLMGGEPLLNNNLVEICKIARNLFHDSEITIHTNGILLQTQPKEFFENCIKYSIHIRITYYGLNLDTSTYKQYMFESEVEGPKFIYYLTKWETEGSDVYFCTKMLKSKSDMSSESLKKIQSNCTGLRGEMCLQLVGDYLYPCQYMAYFKYFKKFFKDKIKIASNPGEGRIDLTKYSNWTLLKDKLKALWCNPPEFCSHCNDIVDVPKDHRLVKRCRSKQDIGEWLLN